MANNLGKRFLRDANELLGGLEEVTAGLWHWRLLTRPIWLVSNRDIPIDRESVPVHLVSEESISNERGFAEMVLAQPDWWTVYGPWLAALHPELWKEIKRMAKKRSGEVDLDYSLIVREMGGIKGLIKRYGLEQVVEAIDLKEVIGKLGVKESLARLSPAQRKELKRSLLEEE